MTLRPDRLYELLPAVYRLRDAERGAPLQALLRVIGEQVDVVEEDIARLYENWFIETCDAWVVPYLGDLIGYRPVAEAGRAGDPASAEDRLKNRWLAPRREIANTLRYRRSKGTLALLELLARDVAGWPARAVEFYRGLVYAQSINHLQLRRGRTADLRKGGALDLIDGPFDTLAHTVDVRRPNSLRTRGRYNIPSVGLFVWRLQSYSVTGTPADCIEDEGPNFFTFSVLGNDAPLFTRPAPEPTPWHIAGETNVPTPIRRRALESERAAHYGRYYGPEKSFAIWVGPDRTPVPPEQLVIADLSGWRYRPRAGSVAVDPVLGRIAFSPRHPPRDGVWVSYRYGFSADVGGGEYDRPVGQPGGARIYRVGEGESFTRIRDALEQWGKDQVGAASAVIEITDSGVYVEQLSIKLPPGGSLQIRAANRRRPVLRLLDWQTAQPDALRIVGAEGSRFTLDGLLVTGRGVEVEGDLACVSLRHTTLVPGWGLHCDCEPRRPSEPSLVVADFQGRLSIEHSIVGSIQVNVDEVTADPLALAISDSILDATGTEREAIGAPGCVVAPVLLTIRRSTVIGQVRAHAIEEADNVIFDGAVSVARRQRGCMRFCYVPSGSRTPRRYHCQPDLAEATVEEQLRARPAHGAAAASIEADIADARALERERVRPEFTSRRYGTPAYVQLADSCAPEILRGADDESEMGVFHDLFQPQREASLRARLAEFTPAGSDAGVIHAS